MSALHPSRLAFPFMIWVPPAFFTAMYRAVRRDALEIKAIADITQLFAN